MEKDYDPNAWYKFTDQNGDTFTARGDDPLVRESITKGLPIYTNEQGEHYIYPYIEQDGNNVIAHIPYWFKTTPQYNEWENIWAPTIPNTEINAHTVSVMNEVLGRLGRDAADSYTTNNDRQFTKTYTTQQASQSPKDSISITNYGVIISVVSFILPAILAIVFAKSIKTRIRQKERFNGVAWGIANGVLGAGIVGLLFVVIAHNSINKELETVKNKKYVTRAKAEMQTFIKVYFLCFVGWIIISAIVIASSM